MTGTGAAGPAAPGGGGATPGTGAAARDGVPAAVRLRAVVLGATRQGLVVETAAGRLLLAGAPPLARGAVLTLLGRAPASRPETAPAHSGTPEPAAPRMVRLTAVDGRALRPPPVLRLAPAPDPPSRTRAATSLPAQAVAPSGRAAGPPVPVRIEPLPASPAAGGGAATTAGKAPTSPAPPADGLRPGATLTAEAAGRDRLGRLLLRAANGLVLRLAEPGAVDLPPGARVSVAFPRGLAPTAPPPGDAKPLRVLVDALRGAVGGEDAAGPPAVRLPLPRPDAALAALLLHLHGAIQRGDAASILPGGGSTGGAEPRFDRAGLREALTELGRSAREPLPGGWRASVLPVVVADGAVEPLRLYVRGDGGEPPGGAGAEPARRAVFDLDLSRLGRVQLDALCRGRNFDLRVRSERELPPALRAEIGALFVAAKDLAGLRGDLRFRPGGLLALPAPRTRRAAPAGLTA